MALRHPTGGVDLLLKVSVLELLRNLVGRADSGDDAVAIDDDGTVDQLSTLRVPVIDDFNLVHGRSAQHLLVVLGNHHELLRIAHNESEGFLHRIGCRFMTVSGRELGFVLVGTRLFLRFRSLLVCREIS